jgi:hypothetical protein
MPIYGDVIGTLTGDIYTGLKLLKSAIWGTYKPCNMNLALADD